MITFYISKKIYKPLLPDFNPSVKDLVVFRKWMFDSKTFVEKIKSNWTNIFSMKEWADSIIIETHIIEVDK